MAELRARLARLGYVVPAEAAAGTGFDDGLAQAVAAFQRDYGLNDDGVVGAMTLTAVNAPIETRLAEVAVNLERLRWMGDAMGERYLVVNIPDFTVTLVEDGQPGWTSKVVVGKTSVTETPEFDGVVKTVVVNPTWHIPDSIAIRDYLPKLQRNPMVLKNQGIDLMTRGGTVINPKLVDFTQYTPANFPFRIKQRPSDDNALGEVKFLFPNEHSVYMHDTPHKELFPRDVRAFSNGCIRLEKPVELAHILLAGQTDDPRGLLRRPARGRQGAGGDAGADDPGAYRLSHRHLRRGRRRPLPARRLWPGREDLRGAAGGGGDIARCAGLRLPL